MLYAASDVQCCMQQALPPTTAMRYMCNYAHVSAAACCIHLHNDNTADSVYGVDRQGPISHLGFVQCHNSAVDHGKV